MSVLDDHPEPPTDSITVHIDGVPRAAITDALVAIERADTTIFDDEQHKRLTTLVLGLRAALDETADAREVVS